MKKELIIENFLQSKKDLFIESRYYILYDVFLSESIDDEFKESIDTYSNYNANLDCYLINIDTMIQEAISYSIYSILYDYESHSTYDKYEINDSVLNEILRLYKVTFTNDVSILIRMLKNLDSIVEILYDLLNDY